VPAVFKKMRREGRERLPSRPIDFDIAAPFYDLGVWFAGLFIGGERRLREGFIDEAMPLEGMRTLEIFAGTATLSLLARKRGARAFATDLSGPMLKVASEKVRKDGTKVGIVRSDSSCLPFSGGSFQRVLVCMGLHEVPREKTEAALCEAARVLEKGGRIVIEDYHRAEGAAGALQRFLFLFSEGPEVVQWLGTDIQGLLRRAGFRDFRRRFLLRGALQLITAEKA